MKALNVFCVKYLWAILILHNIYCVYGYKRQGEQDAEKDQDDDKDKFKKYVVESTYLPPIFGSYKYNPLLHQFELPNGLLNFTTTTTSAPETSQAQSTYTSPHYQPDTTPKDETLRSGKLDSHSRGITRKSSVIKKAAEIGHVVVTNKTI